MDLNHFGKSISEMSIEEIHERLRTIRHSRRQQKEVTKRSRSKGPKSKQTPKAEREMEAILKQMTPEQLAEFLGKVK